MPGSVRWKWGAGAALLLAGLAGCASVGKELKPELRAVDGGWMVSLHQQPIGPYQVLVVHPPGRFNGPPGAVRGRLEGDPMTPYTWGVTRTETRASGESHLEWSWDGKQGIVSSVPDRIVEDRREVVQTTWDFDKARWQSGRPFRLVLWPGFGPPDEVVLEIKLGPEVGRSAGLEVRVVSSKR